MAEESDSHPPAKRQKLSPTADKDMDPRKNPYLAHHYEGVQLEEESGYSNGYGYKSKVERGASNGVSSDAGALLAHFERHHTTAKQAQKAEDGPLNAFSGQNLSSQYFAILKTRRNLPVHAQR